MKRPSKSRWLSPTEAAEHAGRQLGVHLTTKTIDRWLNQGLPFVRIAGLTIRILSADLDAWLDAHPPEEARAGHDLLHVARK